MPYFVVTLSVQLKGDLENNFSGRTEDNGHDSFWELKTACRLGLSVLDSCGERSSDRQTEESAQIYRTLREQHKQPCHRSLRLQATPAQDRRTMLALIHPMLSFSRVGLCTRLCACLRSRQACYKPRRFCPDGTRDVIGRKPKHENFEQRPQSL